MKALVWLLTSVASSRNSYESLKKSELELSLDEYLSDNASSLSSDPKLAPYYQSRAKAAGSPVKKEPVKEEVEKALKVTKRRATKAAEDLVRWVTRFPMIYIHCNPICDARRMAHGASRIPTRFVFYSLPGTVAKSATSYSLVMLPKRVFGANPRLQPF
jgi:hypothetical protein